MKAMLSLFLILFFTTMSAISQADNQADAQDYCYKPSKPLFFATVEYKKRYAEDVEEHQRCRKGFIEMQARVASMKKESEKNAQLIQDKFIIRHY